jgi:hypothetical protein
MRFISRSGIPNVSVVSAFQCRFSSRSAVRSNGYMWISSPIASVHYKHSRPKAAAAAKIRFPAWRWFSESIKGGMVVHGNQPISVLPTRWHQVCTVAIRAHHPWRGAEFYGREVEHSRHGNETRSHQCFRKANLQCGVSRDLKGNQRAILPK